MSIRVSPISRSAALLIIAVGAFVLFTGLVAGLFVNDVAGAIFIVLGLILHRFLFRFTKRLGRKIDDAKR
ncbi:MAG: hypothetical protein KGI38_01120 [Thaumarchaeota archaeon]|nr:hypothetical protein [Nitrososphaerota archaeon]